MAFLTPDSVKDVSTKGQVTTTTHNRFMAIMQADTLN